MHSPCVDGWLAVPAHGTFVAVTRSRNVAWAPLGLMLAVPAFCLAQEPAPELVHEEVEARFGTTVVIPSGLRGQIYFLEPETWSLPKFEKLEPVGTIYTNGLNIPTRSWTDGFPGISKRFEWFAIDYTGRFYISKPGKYRFALVSDDGSKLYIDGRVVINNDGHHPTLRMDGSVKLAGGIHSIRVSYFQGPRDELALMLGVCGPDDKDFRVFNTNEFKPPANPEDWKFGSPNDLPPDPNAGRKRLKDAVKEDAQKTSGR
jgi:hypothetical protein